ncbi:MAG: AI-2E family transporter [Bacteroidetes Order II. Incertae sedis bacterium]|jgi:AI-2 transport protein TqsA|nr:AI-2E family transporter [Bacteroidetes Order II. bacterium]MBT4601715.1 AI-2E family transporter [Bacteroidetes Order II. bacterium]MBT5250592.1 AI-2E family transporter [Bacteroidetes Order II. bacterium]MBT6201270.1 AI-2E family transporter [Bacteroidetes Order II. bacterium]MBT6425839.1 AI-2E family transporter [Bacteroidetes Order II. bacterium]
MRDDQNNNLLNVFLGIIAVFVLGVMLLQLKTVLMPFVIAVLLSIIFKPLILGLREKGIPMFASLFGVLLLFSLVLFLLGWVLFASTEAFVNEIPKYQTKVAVIADGVESTLIYWAERFNMQPADFKWSDAIQLSSIASVLTTGLGSFISFVTTTFLVLLFMLFMLASSGEMAKKVSVAFSPHYSERISSVLKVVDSHVRQYLVTKTLISLGTGFLTWAVLLVLGVDFPLVFGFIAFVLNFIPNIGSTISVLFPFALSLLQFESLFVPLFVILGLGGTQMTMGNVVEPRILGYSLNISPLLILVCLIFWGWLWGIWGMVLAVPITATIKIVFENMPAFRPLAFLMDGPSA